MTASGVPKWSSLHPFLTGSFFFFSSLICVRLLFFYFLQLTPEEHLLSARAVFAGLCADTTPTTLDGLELLRELLRVLPRGGRADGDEGLGAVELAREGRDGPEIRVVGAELADLGDVVLGEVVARVGAAGGDVEGRGKGCC